MVGPFVLSSLSSLSKVFCLLFYFFKFYSEITVSFRETYTSLPNWPPSIPRSFIQFLVPNKDFWLLTALLSKKARCDLNAKETLWSGIYLQCVFILSMGDGLWWLSSIMYQWEVADLLIIATKRLYIYLGCQGSVSLKLN